MWLEASKITNKAQPGQFFMVRCGEGLEHMLRRPLSIHKIDNEKVATRLAFLYRVVGKGTEWLSGRKTGEPLDLLGPLGKGFSIHPASKRLLLVAGGIGVAPIAFLAQQVVKDGLEAKLLLGARTSGQLYPKEFLPPEIEIIIATEDGSAGKKGMITDLLPDFTSWADQVFACGPVLMYRAMASSPKIFNKKPVQISLESRMGCGLGVCYACTVKTKTGLKQVCRDGPVFKLDEIIWDEFIYYP